MQASRPLSPRCLGKVCWFDPCFVIQQFPWSIHGVLHCGCDASCTTVQNLSRVCDHVKPVRSNELKPQRKECKQQPVKYVVCMCMCSVITEAGTRLPKVATLAYASRYRVILTESMHSHDRRDAHTRVCLNNQLPITSRVNMRTVAISLEEIDLSLFVPQVSVDLIATKRFQVGWAVVNLLLRSESCRFSVLL